MWALYSERLREAKKLSCLGSEDRTRNLDPEIVPALLALLESCLGPVEIEAPPSAIREVQFTLQEPLLHDPTQFYA